MSLIFKRISWRQLDERKFVSEDTLPEILYRIDMGWDGGEKFYEAENWMEYIIDHFLRPRCHAMSALPFLQANHTVNGTIDAEGEDSGDIWQIVVKDNKVSTKRGRIVYDD